MTVRLPLIMETMNSTPVYSGGVGVYAEKLMQAYVELLPGFGAAFGVLDNWQGERNWSRRFPQFRYFYDLPAARGQDVVFHVVSAFRCAFRNSGEDIRRFRRCHLVVTHHDFIDQDYPWLFNDAELRVRRDAYRSFSRYEGFVVPSQGVADRLVGQYGIAADRIAVIPHGNCQHLEVKADTSKVPKGRYLLFISKLYPHKNWRRLLAACGAAADDFRREEIRLLFVSSDTEAQAGELRSLAEAHKLEDIVEFCGYVTNAQLAGLFGGCSGFIFPSLAEGFGMPVFEAQAMGIPVCLSDIPIFREVIGIARYPATWFDPYSVDSIAEALREFLPLTRDGKHPAFIRTWNTVAQEHLDFLYRIVT